MNKANISYTRNHLSEMLMRVREGETILIVDRKHPVARLEPVMEPAGADSSRHADLIRRGIVKAGRTRLDPKMLRTLPMPSVRGKGDIVDALLADREESR